MGNWQKRIACAFPYFLVVCVLPLVIYFPELPQVRDHSPYRDSGVFLFIGQQILRGQLPYRDVWDHKAPAIYYIDAAGLLIAGGSEVGVWLIQVVFLILSAYASLVVLTRYFGRQPALYATVAWMLNLPAVLEGGNLTEVYVLLPYFLGLLTYSHYLTRRSSLYVFLIGVLAGFCILLRPNLFGLFVGLAVMIAGCSNRCLGAFVARALQLISGALLPIGAICIYFTLRGGLTSLLDQTISYSLYYIRDNPNFFLATLVCLILFLFTFQGSGLAVLAVFVWIQSVCSFVRKNHIALPVPDGRFLGAVLIASAVELVMIALSARNYPHYYISALPTVAVLVAYFLRETAFPADVQPRLRSRKGHVSRPYARSLVLVSLMLVLAAIPATLLVARCVTVLQNTHGAKDSSTLAALYAGANTLPDATVLVWGAQVEVNFLSNRRAPTRFAYQLPLFTSGYRTVALAEELVSSVKSDPPALIVDASASSASAILPLDRAAWGFWLADPANTDYVETWLELLSFVERHYLPTAHFDGWTIYRYQSRGSGRILNAM